MLKSLPRVNNDYLFIYFLLLQVIRGVRTSLLLPSGAADKVIGLPDFLLAFPTNLLITYNFDKESSTGMTHVAGLLP